MIVEATSEQAGCADIIIDCGKTRDYGRSNAFPTSRDDGACFDCGTDTSNSLKLDVPPFPFIHRMQMMFQQLQMMVAILMLRNIQMMV